MKSDCLVAKTGATEEAEKEGFQKVVGTHIKALRKEKKWSQEKLAQEVSINDKYVYDIESGSKCMSIWLLVKLAKALDADVNDLLYGSGDKMAK